MEITNLLDCTTRQQWRQWLERRHATERECWLTVNRSRPPRTDSVPYVDAVEEALCFGWIDSTLKRLPDGRLAQRFSPRRKGSHWTELNRQRCEELIARNRMTPSGLAALEQAG